MKTGKKKSINVIELGKHVACLASSINTEISRKTYFKITPMFYHKSGSELRLEQQQKMKLLTTTNF
jgi:hypothetical protein